MYVALPRRAISKRSPLRPRIGIAPSNMPKMPNARLCSNQRKAWTNSSAGSKCRFCLGRSRAVDHARIVQLINKTNQFNTTTRRYTSEEVDISYNQPEALTLQFRLLDRIGDNGLVSTMILRPTPDHEDVLEIENWVMSCRVFGRQLEFEAMNIAVEAARRAWRTGARRGLHSHRQERSDQRRCIQVSVLPKSINRRPTMERRAGSSN